MPNLENKDYCFQTLRYGWNSNTPLAILTDFDRFFILDSRYKPSIDTALDRIHKKYHYQDFADEEKFREIYYLFSREAIADGAIEKYAEKLPKARGKRKAKQFRTAQIEPVDEEFLSELDSYREELARAFKNKNPSLDGEALTEITQRTLDRLVFIRFLADKLVEPREVINELGKKSGSAWRDFVAESARLNKIYNGIIFKPHSLLDNPKFAPDPKAFELIRDWLSSEYSPYDFNTIPIHILGSIYERFLGKTIEATDKRAKVVEKPEVRKAGGVYYTPEYIVRYIVENTVGKLLTVQKPARSKGKDDEMRKPARSKGADDEMQKPARSKGADDEMQKPARSKGADDEMQKPARSKGADDEMQKPSRSKGADHDTEEHTYSVRVSAKSPEEIAEMQKPARSKGADDEMQKPARSKGADDDTEEHTYSVRVSAKSPEEIAEMHFADIACGSGSFLLGVFDYLIAYHVRWFDENKMRRANAIKENKARETAEGILQLTLSYKRDILLNNIYGVDLDAQAVEVAQLSLYLKLLEEETTATAQQYLTGFREQLLPSLSKNIVHGNSLIDFDIMDGMLFDTKDLKKLNPLNFKSTFPKVFQKGGFDAIVGNPPYVRQELLGDAKPLLKMKFETYHGVADLYVYFFEQYINLLKNGGEFGIIVANKWLRANYGESLRRWLKQFEIKEIIDFGDLPVFQGATTYPCIVIVRKSDKETESFDSMQIESLEFENQTLTEIVARNKFEVKKEHLSDSGWSLSSKDVQELLDKLNKMGVPLGEYVDGKIYYGIKTGFE